MQRWSRVFKFVQACTLILFMVSKTDLSFMEAPNEGLTRRKLRPP